MSESGAGQGIGVNSGQRIPLPLHLIRSGFKQISWSLKKSRPRGIYSLSPLDKTIGITVGGSVSINPVEVHVSGVEAWSPGKPKTLGKLMGERIDAYTIHGSLLRGRLAWRLASKLIKHTLNNPPLPEQQPGSSYHAEELHTDILVVGGGVAGLSAALEVARNGFKALIVEADVLGGVMRLDHKNPPGIGEAGSRLVEKLVKMAGRLGVRVLEGTRMAGFFEDHPIAYRQEGLEGGTIYKIHAREVIIASGVSEPPALFPGNDLPRIYSSATVVRMVEEFGVPPGRRGVILGDGPLASTLHEILRDSGVEVEWVRDPGDVEALGRRVLEAVEVGGERVEAEFLAVSMGFQPDPRLAQQLGARILYSENAGGFIPLHNEFMEAGGKAIVAGGVTGSPYGVLHIVEGRIAGLTASVRLGSQKALDERDELVKEYLEELSRHAPWKLKALKAYHGETWRSRASSKFILSPHPGEKTYVCLCEDVTAQDLERTVELGFHSLEKVKRCTGLGTGYCQGRLCMGNACSYLSIISGKEPKEIGAIRSRPPITSIPLGALSEAAGG